MKILLVFFFLLGLEQLVLVFFMEVFLSFLLSSMPKFFFYKFFPVLSQIHHCDVARGLNQRVTSELFLISISEILFYAFRMKSIFLHWSLLYIPLITLVVMHALISNLLSVFPLRIISRRLIPQRIFSSIFLL